MRLALKPEPATFEEKVRRPGANALALLAGKKPPHARHGRPPSATKTVGGAKGVKKTSVKKTLDDFPYWRACLDELYDAYGGVCAYYGFHIERVNHPQVDHFVAKSSAAPGDAYEWTNYRLACAGANTQKNKYPDVLDPAAIEDGWFVLNLTTGLVGADPTLPAETKRAVEQTVTRLGLNDLAKETRDRALGHFRAGRANLDWLQLDHPYLARELLRQGVRTAEQLPRAAPPLVLEAQEPEEITPS